jgi:hypothetical protein
VGTRFGLDAMMKIKKSLRLPGIELFTNITALPRLFYVIVSNVIL